MHQPKLRNKNYNFNTLILLTTYNYNQNIVFPFFKIEQIEFRGDNLIEENIKNQIIKELQNKSLFFKKKFKNILSNSNWMKVSK